MTKEPWIGLAEVRIRPPADPLDGAPGAFVNALALLASEDEFCRSITAELAALEFSVVNIKDVEPLVSRIRRTGVVDEINRIASQLSDVTPVLFDEFQAYGH